MSEVFWKLTDEEIVQGLDIMHDLALQKRSPQHPMIDFAYDIELQNLAMMWIDCNRDRTLMKIKYSDEITQLSGNYLKTSPGVSRYITD